MSRKSFPVLVVILPVLLALWGCHTAPRDYNVVFISLDTTRSDFVDTGRGAKAFTPELRRFARKSIVFDRAYSTIPQTLPSHLAMLTSYLPHECGVFSNQYQYDNRFKMIQQLLKEKGYATAGVISLGTLSSGTGIAQGFDRYRENVNSKPVFFATAEQVTREGLRLLNQLKKSRFFLFLHYSDPHTPYAPPSVKGDFKVYLDGKPVISFNAHQGAILRTGVEIPPGTHQLRFSCESRPEDFEFFVLRRLQFSKNCSLAFKNMKFSKMYYNGSHLLRGGEGFVRVKCRGKASMNLFQVIPILNRQAAVSYYRKEVEYMDRYVGKMLRTLEYEKLLENTLVVITGDHGEGLGEREHYFGHVRYLNQQFIHVPFMLHLPGEKPRRITNPVSLVGISPTLLEFMGIHHEGFNPQRSLLKYLKPGNIPTDPVYSFAFSPSSLEDRFSVINWPYQCINIKNSKGITRQEFYNLSLCQSFQKLDEFSPDVVMKYSSKNYRIFQHSLVQWNRIFTSSKLAKAKILTNKAQMERLRTIGYIQ
jgi:membrane-anchored protein YejM (alkaline phosphatase superfamily)